MKNEWVSPAKIISDSVAMIKPEIKKKHIQFDSDLAGMIEKARLVQFYIDPMKSQQVLVNLLTNACKYTGEGGCISFHISNLRDDGKIAFYQIVIADNGCGMSKTFLKHVFEPFEQEQNLYSGSIQGTGLGLAISRQIVRAMGGDIAVESKLGEGSTFTITTAFKYRIISDQVKTTEQTSAKSDLSSIHVMIAEDNSLNAKIARKLLEKKGVSVTWAKDGKEAVDLFSQSAPGTYDAILMDIRMPVMDGLEAARAIRAMDRPDAKAVAIIAMSANAFWEDVNESLAAGMNEHLSKPVEPLRLYDALSKWVG